MIRIVLGIVLLGFVLYTMYKISRLPRDRQKKVLFWTLTSGLICVLLFLTITGRMNWLFALVGAAIPFVSRLSRLIRYIPMLAGMHRYFTGNRAAASGFHSSVVTRFIRLSLDATSGHMDGEILDGKHKSRLLSSLNLDELLQLLKDYVSLDMDSASLLRAYLDRNHAGWQQKTEHRYSENTQPPSGNTSREEALKILGLSEGASEKEITKAHRRLMQKLHPDRDGSSWLAAKINQAKDTLLQ